ncbi:hypothetical protein D6D13_09792 [Aureobasidium pullulans]|uniref:Uncharacterized protein n=1 Tax=Aureobasidium pullulans TaxID=5580 RepID=A0A4S9C3H5_AURPU|nr:hypothetical protein D6D13_09792 [Aureobasidium pullulans]
MRLSVFTVASAAIAAVGTNAVDAQEIPGYEAIPEPSTNKYSEVASSALPTFSIDSLEPTYMPDEDLKPTGIQARAVPASTQTASTTATTDEPTDESYDAFVKWMISRGLEGYTENDEKKLIARDVNAQTTTPIADPPTDGPSDESFVAFVEWMEGRHLEGSIEKEGVRNHARSVPAQAESATDGPADDTFDAFVKWMESREVPEGVEHHARSLEEEDEYPSEEEHQLYARDAEANAHPEEEGSEDLDWSQVFNEELQLHARSLEDDEPVEDGEYEELDQEHEAPPIGRRSESEQEYPVEEDFEEFLARHGYSPEEYSTPTEAHEDAPEPEVQQVAPEASTSSGVASPAAAPTPKPTSAGSSPIPTPTSAASQWSEVASETAPSSSTNIQARSVSSHFRFRDRHHTTSAHPSSSSSSVGTVSATDATAAASITTTTTGRKGFFGLPW